jgi:hypothetical protein
MAIYRGNTELNKLFRGDTEIKKVYRGANLIWQSSIYANFDFVLSMRDLGTGNDLTMRVRRDGISPVTQDFTYQEILDGTLATWLNGANGFCTIYYDRIGSNHAFQNISTLQPIIAENGVVNLENGLPTLNYNGNKILQLTTPVIFDNLFVVINAVNQTFFFGDGGASRIRWRSNTTPPSLQYNLAGSTQFLNYASGIKNGQQALVNANISDSTAYVNNTQPDNAPVTLTSFTLNAIGGETVAPSLIGNFQELGLTTSPITNDADIRQDIINSYNINL